MRRAIVTLLLGAKYSTQFYKHCYQLWVKYAEAHDFDIVVLDQPLDESPRAQSRSPAWQKCLVLSHPQLSTYDQVVWVDADILINPSSPNICGDVPVERIGAVDEYCIPTKEDHTKVLFQMYEHWNARGTAFIQDMNASEYHTSFGLPAGLEHVVQTGVLVMSPQYHRNILEHVYFSYEDKGSGYWNYEMRPLSYEIQSRSSVQWLDPKFNAIWVYEMKLHYPFLLDTMTSWRHKFVYLGARVLGVNIIRECIKSTFHRNFFLHFAGYSRFLKHSVKL